MSEPNGLTPDHPYELTPDHPYEIVSFDRATRELTVVTDDGALVTLELMTDSMSDAIEELMATEAVLDGLDPDLD